MPVQGVTQVAYFQEKLNIHVSRRRYTGNLLLKKANNHISTSRYTGNLLGKKGI